MFEGNPRLKHRASQKFEPEADHIHFPFKLIDFHPSMFRLRGSEMEAVCNEVLVCHGEQEEAVLNASSIGHVPIIDNEYIKRMSQ